MTRWELLYRKKDKIQTVPPSYSASEGAAAFARYNKRNILDLGCGIGRDTFFLSEKGFAVVGVDAAASALEVATQLRQERQKAAEFVRADARNLPFPDHHFEGIYCFGLLHEFTARTRENDVQAVMAEIYRVLADEGKLILSVLSGDPEKGLPHVQLFTAEMFAGATRRFKVIRQKEYDDIGCTGKDNYRVWWGALTK